MYHKIIIYFLKKAKFYKMYRFESKIKRSPIFFNESVKLKFEPPPKIFHGQCAADFFVNFGVLNGPRKSLLLQKILKKSKKNLRRYF